MALEMPPGTREVSREDNLITMNMGPQHPSTHGVFRLILTLDGETVVAARPVMGYLHRSVEKLCESRTYLQDVIFTDRLDYVAAMSTNLPYAMALEKLAGIEVPERAQYIRIIMVELMRIASHLVAIGTFAADAGTFFTPLLYTFREREMVYDIFEMCCGAWLTVSYIRYGGVSRDVPQNGIEAIRRFVEIMPEKIDEYEGLLTDNEIFIARTRNVGILPPELAVAYSVTGPVLRASGIAYDVRRVEPYSIYDRFDFDVPVRYNGDAYDRYMIRVAEMRQSVRIVEQALRDLPEGEIKAKLPRLFRPARGSAYARTESPKGELGFYVQADGKVEPYRLHIRPPSFVNLNALAPLLIGHKVADVVVILGSIDIVMGEVDR